MVPSHVKPSAAPAPLATAALAALLLLLTTDAAAQTRERLWTVTCGLPLQDNSILALLPTGGYTGPWHGDPRSGHLEAKTLNRGHPEGGISTEMWLLSRNVGWWMLKGIRVYPNDLPKLSPDSEEFGNLSEMRQIIDSPFLSQPTIVHPGDPNEEEIVNGQILALLPDASRLRCAPQFDEPMAARVATAQRALARHGQDPGPIDGRMGPRTQAALRAFQTEQGLVPRGQLDDATFERLAAQ